MRIDGALKFPQLKKGETGIQCGFDMSAPVTSDLFLMARRVKSNGLVIGIDADPLNVEIALNLILKNHLPVRIFELALFSNPGKTELVRGKKLSWNQIKNIPQDETVELTNEVISVEQDTLDNILEREKVDIKNIGHINLTLNGSEYFALLGMHKMLSESKNLAMTIIAGRTDQSGMIDGKPDYEMITTILHQYGFKIKFRRIGQFLWWGFFVNLLIRGKWIYGRKNYGVIMAAKGKKKIPWYQSFS